MPVCAVVVHPEGRRHTQGVPQRQPTTACGPGFQTSDREPKSKAVHQHIHTRRNGEQEEQIMFTVAISALSPRLLPGWQEPGSHGPEIPRATSCEQNLTKIEGALAQWAVECA